MDRGKLAQATAEHEKHKFASVLAQIDLASCFRNGEEPQFAVLSLMIYEALEE